MFAAVLPTLQFGSRLIFCYLFSLLYLVIKCLPLNVLQPLRTRILLARWRCWVQPSNVVKISETVHESTRAWFYRCMLPAETVAPVTFRVESIRIRATCRCCLVICQTFYCRWLSSSSWKFCARQSFSINFAVIPILANNFSLFGPSSHPCCSIY